LARREDCAPVAGKSTLNRLELSKLEPTRYHKISHNPVAIRNLFALGDHTAFGRRQGEHDAAAKFPDVGVCACEYARER
jgi:hypothetical protein